MENHTNATELDLHRAEADLETKVAQLKDVVKDKLAGPEHIIETIEKPIGWIRRNPAIAAAIGAGVIVAWRLLARRRQRRAAIA
jgi:hypothetical protein